MKTKPQDSLKWRCQVEDEEPVDETEKKTANGIKVNKQTKTGECAVYVIQEKRCFEKEMVDYAACGSTNQVRLRQRSGYYIWQHKNK